jgi:hypothetical protein
MSTKQEMLTVSLCFSFTVGRAARVMRVRDDSMIQSITE